MNQETLATKRFFEENQVPLSDFWLNSCMNWFHGEQNGLPYTTNELYTKVYHQWLLLDLRDVNVPQLPANIQNEKKIVLNKSTSLQMMSVVDISRPKLWQLQKIKNLNHLTRDVDQETETSSAGKRVLQLTLTDGISEIKATEYKPISMLNLNLKPGLKIRINPPVTVRRGQMMLEPHNVKLLGGEVEEILISHAAENVLARCLNLPENPNPNGIEESFSNMDITNVPPNFQHVQTKNTNTNNPRQGLTNHVNTLDRYCKSSIQNDDVTEEEEMRIAAEVDMLLEAERDMMGSSSVNKKSKTPDLFDDEDFNVDELDEVIKQSEKKIESQRKTPQESSDDFFTDINIDQYLIDNKPKSNEASLKVISVSTLHKYCKNKTVGKFKIHAKFKSVVQKLTVTDVTWSIKITVADDSGDLTAYMHSNLMTDLIGYNPSSIMALKQRVQRQDLNATAVILEAIDGFKEKLIKMNCVMELELHPNDDIPTIIKLT